MAGLPGIGLGACASGPRTTANADPSVDFSRFKTFGFIDAPGTDGERYESLETNYLKASTTRELERRGFRQSDSPDMLINFSLLFIAAIKGEVILTYLGLGVKNGTNEAARTARWSGLCAIAKPTITGIISSLRELTDDSLF